MSASHYRPDAGHRNAQSRQLMKKIINSIVVLWLCEFLATAILNFLSVAPSSIILHKILTFLQPGLDCQWTPVSEREQHYGLYLSVTHCQCRCTGTTTRWISSALFREVLKKWKRPLCLTHRQSCRSTLQLPEAEAVRKHSGALKLWET